MSVLRRAITVYRSIAVELRMGIGTVVGGLVLRAVIVRFDLEHRDVIGEVATPFVAVFPWLGWIGLAGVLLILSVRNIRHPSTSQVLPRVRVTSNNVRWEHNGWYQGGQPGVTGPMCPADLTLLIHSRTRAQAIYRDRVDGVNDRDLYGRLECPTCGVDYKFETGQEVQEAEATAVLLIDSILRRRREEA